VTRKQGDLSIETSAGQCSLDSVSLRDRAIVNKPDERQRILRLLLLRFTGKVTWQTWHATGGIAEPCNPTFFRARETTITDSELEGI